MKTFRYIGMPLFAIMMFLGLAACSSDDDDDDKTPVETLAGTTWKVIVTDENGMQGATFTFNEDGSVVAKPSYWSKVTYSVTDNTLKIVFNDDDYITGTLVVNGNTAAYSYYWADVHGQWEQKEKVHNMTLHKQ